MQKLCILSFHALQIYHCAKHSFFKERNKKKAGFFASKSLFIILINGLINYLVMQIVYNLAWQINFILHYFPFFLNISYRGYAFFYGTELMAYKSKLQ